MGAEDRKLPRYSRQLDIDVDGLEIVTTNISLDGVQLSCPEMRFRGFQSASKDGVVPIRIRLPGTKTWLEVAAAVCYADLCDDEYLIGIRFKNFVADSELSWRKYLDTLEGARAIAS